MRRIGLMLAVIAAAAGCAVSKVEPLTVPLAYKPSSHPDALLTAPSCPLGPGVRVTDQRTDQILGERFHESKPLRADVAADGDAAAWVSDGVNQALSRAGYKTADGAPVLNLGLTALRTSENIWHRSGYDARILFTAELKSRGKTCWQESVEGKSGNYGYSGSIENYQETLNGALDAAASHLLSSALFNSALCHCSD